MECLARTAMWNKVLEADGRLEVGWCGRWRKELRFWQTPLHPATTASHYTKKYQLLVAYSTSSLQSLMSNMWPKLITLPSGEENSLAMFAEAPGNRKILPCLFVHRVEIIAGGWHKKEPL